MRLLPRSGGGAYRSLAAHYLSRCLAVSHPADSIFSPACLMLAQAEHGSGETERAARAIQLGLTHAPDDPELLYASSDIFLATGRADLARRSLERLTGTPSDDTRDPAQPRPTNDYTALAQLYAEMGDREHAVRELLAVIEGFPEYAPA